MTILATSEEDRIPKLNRDSFYCPHCGVLAQQTWDDFHYKAYFSLAHAEVSSSYTYNKQNMYLSQCQNKSCRKQCLWVGEKMILPSTNNFPPPNPDMPEKIKETYNEAAAIANESSRAAAALIRLALQELCNHLECKGNNLYENINFLVKEKSLSHFAKEAMNAVRIVGNNAVHPGNIDLQENEDTVAMLLKLLNFIVKEMISDLNERNAFCATVSASKEHEGNQ